MTLADRFWPKVDRRGPDECWPWLAARSGGYGVIREAGRGSRLLYAHRVALALDGRDPGPETRHTCDDPGCVNPAHLLPGDRGSNMRDMAERERSSGRRLTRGAVLEIRARLAAGETQRPIAADHGVSQRAVSKVGLRQSWTHV